MSGLRTIFFQEIYNLWVTEVFSMLTGKGSWKREISKFSHMCKKIFFFQLLRTKSYRTEASFFHVDSTWEPEQGKYQIFVPSLRTIFFK